MKKAHKRAAGYSILAFIYAMLILVFKFAHPEYSWAAVFVAFGIMAIVGGVFVILLIIALELIFED